MKKFTFKLFILACSLFLLGYANGQDVIDLTGIDNANILVDTLPDIPDGAVVLLEPGRTYNGGYAFDKSVTLQSSDPTNEMKPLFLNSSDCNFAADAMIDSLIFKNLEITGAGDSYNNRYVINSNVSATIGDFKFESCYIHSLRGVFRMKDAGPGSVENYIINDCIIDSIRDYAILTVDMTNWMVNNIMIKNSTIYKCRAFITNKNNSNSLVIDGCTINEVPATGQRLFRWRESGQDNVTEGITIKNTLWGPGWDETGVDSTDYDGFDGLGATEWKVENTWATSDLVFQEGKDTIFALLEKIYDGASTDLWTYPYEGEFFFLEESFVGIGIAGDPRWAPEMPAEGTVWNISSDAFNALGELTATTTVEGLTIYAADGKSVIIEANDKEVDGMTFTHRLKLGGSGGFDENGLPLNRVLAFDVAGNSKITVAAMSSSSSTDRILNMAAGHKDSIHAEIPAPGPALIMGSYNYIGEATKIFLYSPSSGVNVYYIKVEPLTTVVNQISAENCIVNIYPNPATDKVYVDYNKPIQVAVYNIAGSLVKSKMIQSKSDYISISDLQPGMYLIRSQNDNTFASKFIKR